MDETEPIHPEDDRPPHARLPMILRRDKNVTPGIEWYDHQYTIICQNLRVGHIGKTFPRPSGDEWIWTVTCALDRFQPDLGGMAKTFEEAKKAWKKKWESVTPDFEQQRAIEYRAAENERRTAERARRSIFGP